MTKMIRPKPYIDKLREVYRFSEDIWTSLISVDGLDLQVVIVYVGVVKLFVLVSKVRDLWEWLNCMHIDTNEEGAVMSR